MLLLQLLALGLVFLSSFSYESSLLLPHRNACLRAQSCGSAHTQLSPRPDAQQHDMLPCNSMTHSRAMKWARPTISLGIAAFIRSMLQETYLQGKCDACGTEVQ